MSTPWRNCDLPGCLPPVIPRASRFLIKALAGCSTGAGAPPMRRVFTRSLVNPCCPLRCCGVCAWGCSKISGPQRRTGAFLEKRTVADRFTTASGFRCQSRFSVAFSWKFGRSPERRANLIACFIVNAILATEAKGKRCAAVAARYPSTHRPERIEIALVLGGAGQPSVRRYATLRDMYTPMLRTSRR